MTPKKSTAGVLRNISIGFSGILVCIWIVELVHLPHYLFGEPAVFYWPRVLIRTAIVGLTWLWMHVTIARLLHRLRELEDLLRICSWCRKVGHDGRWLSFEDFFGSAFQTKTSHSICPDCAEKARARLLVPPAA